MKFDLPCESWRKQYKDLCVAENGALKVGIIGKSILGRDIDYYKFGSGRKNIVIVGAHHAMEYITAMTLYSFLNFLQKKSTRSEASNGINFDFLQQKFTYWVVPCLNPDGVELHLGLGRKSPLYEREVRMNGDDDFSLWQANSRGVDLNHNYDYRFSEYKIIEAEKGILAGKTRYSGEYPESEPETKAIANFIRILKPVAVVSLHSQGEEIFYQPSNAKTERMAGRVAKFLKYSLSEPEGLSAYGGLCDYTGAVLGIPSLTIEIGKGKNPLPPNLLPVLSEKIENALIRLPLYL